MKLLVSVANAEEAVAARDGGADLVDAKDPSSGALGALSLPTLREIHAVVAGARPLTAALGDAEDERYIERKAFEYAAAGCTFVKVGFAAASSTARTGSLLATAVRGARHGSGDRCGVVAVAYVDEYDVMSGAPADLIDLASREGARGVLLDTANKSGPGLTRLVRPRALRAWVSRAHDRGLLTAVAGRLTLEDLPSVQDSGADIAGVRGAACEGGRTGRVTATNVRLLKERLLSSEAVVLGLG
ncbi:MAG TPA: (5-formylfuran-3-yl)methyl phosphate synthase [Vicinamibacterales bacterium]|nr:(5-formylfuran-3-yl)methyl phosphate synthase [Vicinamibacterales bacterium]